MEISIARKEKVIHMKNKKQNQIKASERREKNMKQKKQIKFAILMTFVC